ncbi:MAG: sugar kinase [Verrucomicrobia bacterium]|nr:sugar kinase [Verrucomicrobiota bacterium]
MSLVFDVVTFGESMVLFSPAEWETLESSSTYHVSIGGAESNCAIGLARLGYSVSWVSRIGRDPFGTRVLKTIRGEGVDVSRVEVCDSAPTGLMFKEPGPGNTTQVFYYRRQSAAATLNLKQFDSLSAKYLFVTGITPALSESNRKLTFHVVERFRASGAKIVFDPNMRFRLWSPNDARSVFIDLARNCDVLIPSLGEAEIMTGVAGGEATLDALLSLGPAQVILKDGEKGAWYADGKEQGFCPSHPVREIDPVGAGDAFCAGVLSGLIDGQPLADCVRRGAALGAFCVSTFGDYQGLPDRNGLKAFMEGTQSQGR